MVAASVSCFSPSTAHSALVGLNRAHNLQCSRARLHCYPVPLNASHRYDAVASLGREHEQSTSNADRLPISRAMQADPANEFQGKAVGVIVVDHGSRKAESNQSLGKTSVVTRCGR